MNLFKKKAAAPKIQKKNYDSENEDDEEDLIPENSNIKDEKVDKLINDYYNEENSNKEKKNDYADLEDELENEMITKLQNDVFKTADDIIYDLFSKVVSYDQEQIIRYCRDDLLPLWFNKNGMLTMKNTKCKNCNGELIFEFQVMPNIFNLYREIMNIDIGIIVIYTCKKSCNKSDEFNNSKFVEEMGFIQRTGEKVIDFDNYGKKGNSNDLSNEESWNPDELIKNLSKVTVKNNTNNSPDEEGWVEVKKKGKK